MSAPALTMRSPVLVIWLVLPGRGLVPSGRALTVLGGGLPSVLHRSIKGARSGHGGQAADGAKYGRGDD